MSTPSGIEPREPHATPSGPAIPLAKLLLLAGLALATVIPSYFVSGLIDERESRQAGVKEEFSRVWGPQQQFRGPVLVLPYRQATGMARRYVEIAPTRLSIAAALTPETRRRGLFRATVYGAAIGMRALFSVPDEAMLKARNLMPKTDGQLLWNEAFIAVGATSFAGLTAQDDAVIAGAKMPWSNCREVTQLEGDCPGSDVIVANANLTAPPQGGASLPFDGSVHLRGTGSLTVQSAAKELDGTIDAPWPTPSFIGAMLPVTSKVTGQRFDAHWQSTNYGAARISAASGLVEMGVAGSISGVDLIEATPVYRMIERTTKYSLLLVVLSFATYFFFELLSRIRIHPVQYGLLGLSLSLFALLLLSLGEVIGYTPGFVTSAGLVLLQSSLYTAAVARRTRPAIVFGVMLASLFGFLYVLLSLETYSLLVGALALFAVLSILMALTQRVKWIDASWLAASH